MASLTCTIEPDEFLGLRALVELDKAAGGGDTSTDINADAVGKAKALLHTALADKLEAAGLPWAPPVEAVGQCATEAAEQGSAMHGFWGSEIARKRAAYAAGAALVVVLWGGYVQGWPWTGFQANGQLWDWLTLLLLPVVLGTIPLWIQYKQYIGEGRRAVYAAVIVAWIVFVIASYLIPLTWTGFPGKKLWDWLTLLAVPAAVTITVTLISRAPRRAKIRLRPSQKALLGALAAGWIVTVIGGYALQWSWTGYAGNTLWNWLGMLLPLVFPVILLPPLLIWVSGNAASRASAAARQPEADGGHRLRSHHRA
jgi:hypothetical protein